eukprot:6226676-Pyramimonas_sp.AAC.1
MEVVRFRSGSPWARVASLASARFARARTLAMGHEMATINLVSAHPQVHLGGERSVTSSAQLKLASASSGLQRSGSGFASVFAQRPLWNKGQLMGEGLGVFHRRGGESDREA